MKQHTYHPFLNLSGSIYDHRDQTMLSSQAYPHTDFKLQLHSQHNSYLKDRPDHAASALKRDRLKTYNEELSTYTNNSALFPPSGMTHKRYLANIEGKLLSSKPKHSDFSLNHSSTLYPYSFTEYQRMKAKIHERSRAQDQWLQTQLARMKHQDQIMQVKDKMKKKQQVPYLPLKIQNKKKVKEIFNEFRQHLKKTNTNESSLSDHKQFINPHQFINQSFQEQSDSKKIHGTKNKNLSSSQVMSSDSKSKKSQRRQRYKQTALKAIISQHLSISPNAKDKKKRKKEAKDRYKYVSDRSDSELDGNSALKSQYLNRYDYLLEREKIMGRVKTHADYVTDDMIDRAFVFDELNECQSDFEDEVEVHDQFRKKDVKYKDSLDVVYQKLYRTPERQKDVQKQNLNKSQHNRSNSQSKQDNRSNELLASIQRKKAFQKRPYKPSPQSRNVTVVGQKHMQSSADQCQSQAQHLTKSKLQQSIAQSQQMQIDQNRLAQYPVFSPYSQHKQLPHEAHEYLTASLERKKLPKQGGALSGMKRETDLKQHHMNVKDLIVDEIERKKILSRQQPHHEVATQETKHYHMEIIGTIQKQRQEHNNHNPQANHDHTSTHPLPTYQPIHSTFHYSSNQSSQTMAKNLKIELEILKQQLEDKNRKVVDLELELMQIKNSFLERKEEKEDESTTTKSRLPNQDSRKDVIISQDTQTQTQLNTQLSLIAHTISQCQTQQNTQLSFIGQTIYETILPDDKTTKSHNSQLFKTKNHIKTLQNKLSVQEQALTNLFEDLGMYQKLNQDLQNKIKALEREKNQK